MPVPLLRRAIRHRHSVVDEERGGHVVARHIEKLIESVQHLRPVTITHHLLMTQGARLHAGSLECGDARIPPS